MLFVDSHWYCAVCMIDSIYQLQHSTVPGTIEKITLDFCKLQNLLASHSGGSFRAFSLNRFLIDGCSSPKVNLVNWVNSIVAVSFDTVFNSLWFRRKPASHGCEKFYDCRGLVRYLVALCSTGHRTCRAARDDNSIRVSGSHHDFSSEQLVPVFYVRFYLLYCEIEAF